MVTPIFLLESFGLQLKKKGVTMRKIRTQAISRKSGGTPVDPGFDVETTVAIIQSLIPLGLQAVEDALQVEVTRLVGPRYSRTASRRMSPGGAANGALCI